MRAGWRVTACGPRSLRYGRRNRGRHELRTIVALCGTIADYLRRTRGLTAEPDRVFISAGIVHAVHLLSRLYLRPGAKVVMENPGYPLVRQLFEAEGAKIVPCPVDDDGLVVEALPRSASGVTFVYVTPSHQFPCGGRLSTARRAALVDWATRHRLFTSRSGLAA